ncbi:MAG: quinolinate synthase NadA [Euryarchaeota archaeon]|nr:quinolinate synthase NadA [Euryarchaeota archaeon]
MDWEALKLEVRQLLDEKDAVLMVHNYQRPEIQDVADELGDSLALCQKAQQVDRDRIVFCGVDFMAEAAKILNPSKVVHHPDLDSVCPMAHMVDTEGLKMLQEQKPDAVTVSYINTSSEVKALTDICCTSANAVDVVRATGASEIIFTPDTNLGMWIKRKLPEVEMHFWPGYCPTHMLITVPILKQMRAEHPEAEILAHPECTPDVIDFSDGCFSTEGMIKYAARSPAKEFIVASERDMAYRLHLAHPEKTFHPVSIAVCPNMKKITLQKVRDSLKHDKGIVELDEDLMDAARRPLEKMVAIGRSSFDSGPQEIAAQVA